MIALWKKIWPPLVVFSAIVWLVWAGSTSIPANRAWNQDQRLLLPAPDFSSVWFQPNVHNRDIVMMILGVLALVVVIFGLYYWLKKRTPVFIMMTLGAICCSFTEPYNSLMVTLYYIRYEDWQLFEFLGRPMNIWLVLLYIVMYGTFGVLAYFMFVKSITKKRLWLLYLFMGVVDVLLELPLCNTPGLYVYHGNEMLMFHRYPTWMAALNGVSMVAVMAMVIMVSINVKQWWLWFIIPLLAPVMCVATGYGIMIWPGEYIVNNVDHGFDPILTQFSGIVVIMLCCTAIWAMSQVLCTDGRFDLLTPKSGAKVNRKRTDSAEDSISTAL